MKKNIMKTLGIVILVLVLILVGNCLYTVHPKEYVAVRQFGRIVNINIKLATH